MNSSANARLIRRYGTLSWYLLGIIALIVVGAMAIGAIRGIVVPLIVAIILGTILDPIVTFLEKRGVKPAIGAVVALLTTIAVFAGTLKIVINGLIEQIPEISQQAWDPLESTCRHASLSIL